MRSYRGCDVLGVYRLRETATARAADFIGCFPDGMHCMHIYRNNGGATVDWSTTITIQNTETAAEKNIFFHCHEQEPDEAICVSNDTVRINGMKLNIYNDYYESFDPK